MLAPNRPLRRLVRRAAPALALAALLAAQGASAALAATPIYVRPLGDDALCNGTVDVDYSGGAAPDCAVATIQKGVDLVDVGGTVNVAAGTYSEDVAIGAAKDGISIVGAGEGSTTIDVAGHSGGGGQSGISIEADDVTLEGFTMESDGAGPPNSPRYGVRFLVVSGGTLQHVTITGLFRSGVDAPSVSDMTFDDITATDNGGNGLGLRDINDSTISNITTSGNAWGGIRIQTHEGPLDGVVISGTNSFGEDGQFDGGGCGCRANFGLYLEQGNDDSPTPGPPYPITYGHTGTPNVLLQSADFAYALGGGDNESPQYDRIWLFKTLASATAAATAAEANWPDHLVAPRFITDIADGEYWVDDGTVDMLIQEAIDEADAGATINVLAGTYDEDIDIDGVAGLTIDGADQATTIVKPSTTPQNWNACGQTTGRQTVVRVVDSTDVTIQDLTFDLDLIRANNRYGLLYCNSTGTVHHNHVKNVWAPDISGGYVELASRFQAPPGGPYTDGSRAEITVSDNTFTDPGRVAVNTHGFVDMTITGNTFTKVVDDFGYAIELGSHSIGLIEGNTISGYDTPALSDGSISAGIYIESAFTSDVITPAIVKSVEVADNEVFGSQYAMTIGNEFDGFTGNVDIVVDAHDNDFHDNADGGVIVSDEDAEDGSSVTATFTDNTVVDNGNVGYYLYTQGDGDLAVTIDGDTITGHDVGVQLEDTAGGSSGSTYDIDVHHSDLSGNSIAGIDNDHDLTTIDATNNWWGSACGPSGEGPGNGTAVSTDVLFSPWWADALGASTASEGAGGTIVVPAGSSTAQIQAILDCAAGSTVVFATSGSPYPGGLIVTGNGTTIDLNGQTVGPGSPAFTIAADDVTIAGPGTLDGGGSGDPAILVQAGADNAHIHDVEIMDWADGVQVAGDVTSFKLIGNWIHDNADAGLQIDIGASLGGIVTIEGNLFKANGGNGIENDGDTTPLPAEYNGWGHVDGPGSGDGVSAGVDADPWTYVEPYVDMEPDTDATEVSVSEGSAFTVELKAVAENVNSIAFELTYDTVYLTLDDLTFAAPWAGTCTDDGSSPGTVRYYCALLFAEWDGGTIAELEFTAANPAPPTAPGPWITLLDLAHDEADTSAAAFGGAKVFVDNAGYGAPSAPERDITDGDDGKVTIVGKANYSGFVDLQGRGNDAGASIQVYNQALKAGSTLLASGTTAGSGSYATAHIGLNELLIGSTYHLLVDRDLFVATTAQLDASYAHSKLLSTRPFTGLTTLVLRGGDAYNDNVINVSDASCIGTFYGTMTAACGGGSPAGSSPDVNEDGTVNILDLALMGGNYEIASSTWAP